MWTGHWPADAYSGRKLGQAELLQPPGAKVMLSGFFQRFEYIADIREEVREDWLRMDDPLPVRPSGDFAICLRLGGGDDRAGEMEDGKGEVQREDGALHEAEVRRLARMVPHERLYIVTDEPGHPMIESLKDLHPIIQSEGGTKDFRFIHSFQKVAISQNAPDWWAAFLGAGREIYFPKMDRGPWSHPEPALLAHEPGHYGIDLRVPDEERYIYDW